MAKELDILFNVAGNLIRDYAKVKLGFPNQEPGGLGGQSNELPEVGDIPEIKNLQNKDGHVITILGRPEIGKSVLAARIAEIISKPTYIISPVARPPRWMTQIDIKDVETEPPPYSTLILDDMLEYMNNKTYYDKYVQLLEKVIFTARHERKLMVISCSQSSGLGDRHALAGGIICLKPPSILFEDLDRPHVIKLHKRAMPNWEGRSERWLQRHAYILTHTWEGLVRVNKPTGKDIVLEGDFEAKEEVIEPLEDLGGVED